MHPVMGSHMAQEGSNQLDEFCPRAKRVEKGQSNAAALFASLVI